MKIDFNQQLVGIDGKPFKQGNEPDSPNATLLHACAQAVASFHPGDERIGTDEKLVRYRLLKKIHDPEPSLSVEEITQLKRLVGILPTPIVGAICDILDPE
jgi:hypothetical protein